jgi:nucleotide-binding universal stress UspA family protein
MPYKLILVPLSGHYNNTDPESLELPALDAAFRIGKALDARVRVFLIDSPPLDRKKHRATWMPVRGIGQVIEGIDAASERRRKYALQSFQSTIDRFDAPLVSEGAASGFAVEYLEANGGVAELLAAQGRLADLIVAAHPPADGPTNTPLMLEIALRETGRPVFVTPVTPLSTIAEHVAIAWNGSSEAARAVALSLDLLRQSGQVTIVSVQEDFPIEPNAQQLADYLKLHNIKSSSIVIEGSGSNAGARLLAESERAGADLLLMGAYSRGRARRLIFGTATNHILRKATIPVIMVD